MHSAKYFFFVLLLLVTVGAGCSSKSDVQNTQANPENTTAEERANAEIQATLVVDKKTYAATVEEGSTALELMNVISQRHDLTFSGKDYGELGLFLEAINGVTNNPDTQQYWTLYVNNAMAQVGVSSYVVQNGDTVEWRYEILKMDEVAEDVSSDATDATENENVDEDTTE